jgi:hypothetical protein
MFKVLFLGFKLVAEHRLTNIKTTIYSTLLEKLTLYIVLRQEAEYYDSQITNFLRNTFAEEFEYLGKRRLADFG